MNWIDVKQRVPDTRRRVLAWGHTGFAGMKGKPEGSYLGATKFNWDTGGGAFDLARTNMGFWCVVTHWAEIEGPVKPTV